MSPLAALLSVAADEQPGLDEVRRVVSLSVERRLTPPEVEEVSRAEVSPEWFAGTHPDAGGKPFRLWRQQAEALMAFDLAGGGFFPLRVGGGKTAISFLCVKRAHVPRPLGRGIKRSLLVVPARGFRKLIDLDVPKMRRILGLDIPIHVLGGMPPSKRLQLCRAGLAGLYCTTYSLLQKPQALEELEAISPQLVVCDEAHVLANSSTHAAMKRRLWRTLDKTRAMFVGLSGTMSRKSLLDCWPLIVYALRERAPVPLQAGIAEFWAAVIDTSARPTKDLLAALEPLRQWALAKVMEFKIAAADVGGPLSPDADGMRRAFRVRRNTAPGVVAAAETELGTTLSISNRPCFAQVDAADDDGFAAKVVRIEAKLETDLPRPLPEDFVPREEFAKMPPFERLVALSWALRSRWRTPNGDAVEWAIHTWQGQYELAAGFYNELVWPTPDYLVEKWHISKDEAEECLEQAKDHQRAQRRYIKEVGDFLKGPHVPGLDTPLLIWNACMRGGKDLPKDLYARWLGVKAAEVEGMPERLSRTARVCDWKIRAAIEWAREVEVEEGEHVGGLVWCWNVEVGEWAHEEFLKVFGPDRVLFCPAGRAADRAIQDPSSGRKFTIASIAGHGEIKDLFHFRHQVFIQWPRGANTAEQTIGRTHRPGQEADELVVRTLNTLDFDHANYAACLHDAMWLSQAEAKQKIIHANYEPQPKVFPARFLQERGFQLSVMDQDSALRLVFGIPSDTPSQSSVSSVRFDSSSTRKEIA